VDVGKLAKLIDLGHSVSINGVCLTATAKKGTVVSFDLMKETIEKTSLNPLIASSRVNLELALRADARLGGHFVTGHIDAVGTIKHIGLDKNYVAITITLAKDLKKYLVNKGSVVIDGISLTVGSVGKVDFTVHLIPFTLKATTLGDRKKGDVVNIETDILAKYILNKA
jgi:riboflavin synthase